MAAIIQMMSRRRRKQQEGTDGQCAFDDMDTNKDGFVCAKELKAKLEYVDIRADIMVQRLDLERDMCVMMLKIPNFFLCVLLFIVALMEFSPAQSIHNVHRHLRSHFQLLTAKDQKDLHSIYTWMENFEKRNAELQATSGHYWCERRYSALIWDYDLEIPRVECKSPRQYAMSLSTDPSSRWSAAPGAGSASGGSCTDNDAALQQFQGSGSVTCASAVPHVCEIKMGIVFCPRTCGFCRPFEYVQKKRFVYPQVTMLPVMVYQTRFPEAECHGFAETYNRQPHNEVLWFLPALDGKRSARLLSCVDRTKHSDKQYAFDLECPADGPASLCDNSSGTPKMHVTQKNTFHGETIYARILVEPHTEILSMEAAEWIDLQTDKVALSTMVYTEGSEIFTSITVTFTLDGAGNIDGSFDMISYRDMIKGARDTFIACLVLCSIFALVGMVLSLVFMFRNLDECKWGLKLYELFSRTLLFVYPLALLITWGWQVPMSEEYDHLLHTFLDLQSSAPEDLESTAQAYFDAKTLIYHENNWLKKHRIFAYATIFVQFLQLVFYCSAHPKMALLTSTVYKALDSILHFLLLFTILFLMLSFAAHWMLGEVIEGFGTFSETIETQGRMIYGEFIHISGLEDLSGVMAAMYWIYALTFLLVIFFTLLNFFLAIIVDAFAEVKEDNAKLVVVQSFPADIVAVVRTQCLAAKYRWPSRARLHKFFQARLGDAEDGDDWFSSLEEEDSAETKQGGMAVCTVDEFKAHFQEISEDTVAHILSHYLAKSKSVLVKKPGAPRKEASSKPSLRMAAASNLERVHPIPAGDCEAEVG